jgi:hypothetical protein
MWRRAVVLKTTLSEDNKTMVQLKLNIKGMDIIEQVEIGSKRLAPFKFFTKGRYL